MDFSNEDNTQSIWEKIGKIVLVNTSGISDLQDAITKMYEKNDYEQLVLKAMANGQKHPQILSDQEKEDINQLYKQYHASKKRFSRRSTKQHLEHIQRNLPSISMPARDNSVSEQSSPMLSSPSKSVGSKKFLGAKGLK